MFTRVVALYHNPRIYFKIVFITTKIHTYHKSPRKFLDSSPPSLLHFAGSGLTFSSGSTKPTSPTTITHPILYVIRSNNEHVNFRATILIILLKRKRCIGCCVSILFTNISAWLRIEDLDFREIMKKRRISHNSVRTQILHNYLGFFLISQL